MPCSSSASRCRADRDRQAVGHQAAVGERIARHVADRRGEARVARRRARSCRRATARPTSRPRGRRAGSARGPRAGGRPAAARRTAPRAGRSRVVPSGSRRGIAASWKQTATCSSPAATPRRELALRALHEVDLGRPGPAARCAGRDDRGHRARERADAQARGARARPARSSWPSASASRSATTSACSSSSAPASVSVSPPGPRSSSRAPDLALQRGDLLRHRGLGQRERLGRARERAEPGDLAERQHAAGIKH